MRDYYGNYNSVTTTLDQMDKTMERVVKWKDRAAKQKSDEQLSEDIQRIAEEAGKAGIGHMGSGMGAPGSISGASGAPPAAAPSPAGGGSLLAQGMDMRTPDFNPNASASAALSTLPPNVNPAPGTMSMDEAGAGGMGGAYRTRWQMISALGKAHQFDAAREMMRGMLSERGQNTRNVYSEGQTTGRTLIAEDNANARHKLSEDRADARAAAQRESSERIAMKPTDVQKALGMDQDISQNYANFVRQGNDPGQFLNHVRLHGITDSSGERVFPSSGAMKGWGLNMEEANTNAAMGAYRRVEPRLARLGANPNPHDVAETYNAEESITPNEHINVAQNPDGTWSMWSTKDVMTEDGRVMRVPTQRGVIVRETAQEINALMAQAAEADRVNLDTEYAERKTAKATAIAELLKSHQSGKAEFVTKAMESGLKVGVAGALYDAMFPGGAGGQGMPAPDRKAKGGGEGEGSAAKATETKPTPQQKPTDWRDRVNVDDRSALGVAGEAFMNSFNHVFDMVVDASGLPVAASTGKQVISAITDALEAYNVAEERWDNLEDEVANRILQRYENQGIAFPPTHILEEEIRKATEMEYNRRTKAANAGASMKDG